MSSNAVLITISSLGLLTSSATLALVIYGGLKGLKAKRQIDSEITAMKLNTNKSIQKVKAVLDNLEV